MKNIRIGLVLVISLFMFMLGASNIAYAGTSEGEVIRSYEWENTGKKMWIYESGGIRYYDGYRYLANEWLQTEGYWFYFGSDGFMLCNGFTPDGYYVGDYGAMETNKILTDGTVIGEDGRVAGNAFIKEEAWQWVLEDGIWYYRDVNSGKNWTGWLFEGGYWYWLKEDGRMATGFLRLNENGKDVLYYLNDNTINYQRWTSLDLSGTRIEGNIPYGAMLSNGSLFLSNEKMDRFIQEYSDILKIEMGYDWTWYELNLMGYFFYASFDENGRFTYDVFDDILEGSAIVLD